MTWGTYMAALLAPFLPLQDLKKLAHETSTKLDGKLQEQLAGLQAQLFEEKKQRVDAEADAQVGPPPPPLLLLLPYVAGL